jgi:hypothetical protein
MKAPLTRSLAGAVALVLAGAASTLGCGASIQAIYEGDVRFEHCMALDAQPRIKSRIRRACWQEWVSFYTYGQTRDRVAHAQLRIRQLGDESAFVSGVPPENTPLWMPPPEGGESAARSDAAMQRDACSGTCKMVHEECNRECDDRSCRDGCVSGLRSCMRDCG